MINYLLGAFIIVWCLGIPTHYSEWDHYRGARLFAAFWPVTIVLCWPLGFFSWIYEKRPRWRWRKRWLWEVSIKHVGWTTKTSKLCGLIKVDKVFGRAEGPDFWVFSGFICGDWSLGTLTRPELMK